MFSGEGSAYNALKPEPENYLTVHWMQCLQEEAKKDAESSARWPVRVLDRATRVVVWSTTELLIPDYKLYGSAGQACRIFERYITAKVREESEIHGNNWDDFKDLFISKIIPVLISSVQLATKMCHSGVQLSTKTLHSKLHALGIHYSIAELRVAEFEVYRTLGFRLPMWSTLEVAELFAKKVGLGYLRMSEVVNLVELMRSDIEKEVGELPNMNKFNGIPAIGMLELSAACLCTTARLMDIDEGFIIEQIAPLINAPPLFIKCVSDIMIRVCFADGIPDSDSEMPDAAESDENSGDEDDAHDGSESNDSGTNDSDDDDVVEMNVEQDNDDQVVNIQIEIESSDSDYDSD